MPSKTPPLSLRIPPGLMAEIDKLAEATGSTRHAAALVLLAQGVGANSVLTPPSSAPKTAKQPRDVAAITKPLRAAEAATAALFQRRAFNPQPKKGTKK